MFAAQVLTEGHRCDSPLGYDSYAVARRSALWRVIFAQASGVMSLICQVGHFGQAGKHLTQIGEWVEASSPATFNNAVDNGAALTCLGVTDKEPVLLANS